MPAQRLTGQRCACWPKVAREAGVGKATLFRHFTTPQQLVDAVFAYRMNACVQATAEALAGRFADVLTFPAAEALEELRTEAYHGCLQIIDRAKGTGHLQADFEAEDLILLLTANAGVISATANEAPELPVRLVGAAI